MLSATPRVAKIWLIVALSLVSSCAWGQASVNESLETASIYVDGKTGSDSNPGTQTLPLKTIGAAASMAMRNNMQSVGSRVIINPGTYRESVSLNSGKANTSLPITFQPATSGTVFVSGADVWAGWTPYGGNASIYTQSWPYRWGLCPSDPTAPIEQPITLRREMIVVNGQPLTEVLSISAMQPGTFFPDEAASTVYVWPPIGTNMATATVEVATRPTLFSDNGQSFVVVRGLTFQYANSCVQNPAVQVVFKATNVLIDKDNFLWNNAMGLAFAGGVSKFTVQNSVANHNGEMGFHTAQVKYGSWQSDTTAYNNWRGAQGAFYSWDAGGTKFMWDHNSTFNKLSAVYNLAPGAAFDTDNRDATITSLVAVGNYGNGFFAEKSEGPLTFASSYFCGNNLAGDPHLGGFSLRDSALVTLTGNTLFGNGGAQITVAGRLGGYLVDDWETGQTYDLVNENFTLSKNIVAGPSLSQVFSDGYLGGTDWSRFASTLTSDTNTWWAGANSSAFTIPSPQSWTPLDMASWRSTTGQDQNSTWASATSPPQCNVPTQGPDYFFLMLTNVLKPVTTSPAGVATWNVGTMPLGGMTGTVKLTLDGISKIPGASASVSPTSISTSGTAALTLTTGLKTPAGTYPLTIIANSGSLTHTITVSVVVPKSSVRLSTTSLTFPAQKRWNHQFPADHHLDQHWQCAPGHLWN